jgi:hypothetical protein
MPVDVLTPNADVEAATLAWFRKHGLPVADVADVGAPLRS